MATARPLLPGVLDCVLAWNEHGAYAVPSSSRHRPAAQAIIGGDVWERETVDLLRRCDPTGDIVHAGTYFGDFLPAVARSRDSAAMVWAFEPNAENFRCAQITVVLNDLGNVVLSHAALADKAGNAALAVRSEDGLALGGGSHLTAAAPGHEHTEPVALVRVDDAVPADRRVAVIQLDVEGHEREALTGAVRTIERCRPMLVLENPPDRSWFSSHLGSLSYTEQASVCGNTVLVPEC